MKAKQKAKNDTLNALYKAFPEDNHGMLEKIAFIDWLFTQARRVQTLNERACNVGLTDKEQKRSDKLDQAIIDRCKEWNIQVEVNGDPRGFPIKLILPNGDCNSAWERVWGISAY